MNKSPEKNQIFFELAMAIGGSLHLYEMLRTALHSYLQQLDCIAGIVYKVEHEGLSRISSEMIFSIPYTLAVRKRYKELENLIPTFHSKANFEEYQSSLPLKSRNKTEVFFHIMNLEEFGFLVLVKQDCYLEDDILIRLQEVNQKLAHTCNACVKHDKVEESEKRYHDLSLLLPEMVCETNREGKVTFANKFAIEKFGYSMRDLKKGFAIANIFPPNEHERFLKNFKLALINDNLPPRQYKAIKKDGTTFPVLVYTSRLIKNRKIEGLRGVMVDITERKEYENKVRQYTERLELALLGSNAGLWDWNILTGEVYFSERWCSMLGYELSEVEPNVSSWERLVHPDDLPHVMEVLNKHLENGVALYQSEHRVKTKSGEWKWILDTGKVIQRDDSGKAIRAVGTHIDISERNRNEELANIERDLGIKLGKSKNLQQTLNICLESSIKYSQMDCGGIYMANESDGSYNLVQQIGLSDDFIKNASYYTADSPNAKTISEGKPIYTKHKKTIRKGDALKGEVFNALAVIPILYLNKPVGCLNLASRSMMSIPDYSRIILERISQYIGSFIIQARQEDRLRQNQQDLNTLFNTIDDFLFILDTEGRMIYFNSTVTERLGYSEKELINEHVLKVHPPARHDEATLRIQGMLMGTETVCGVPLLCKDNTEIPVETKVKKGTWSGKEVIIGICRNTAERKGYEKQIKENTERLEMALLASEAGLWDWNIKTNELILNEKWFAMRSFDNSQAKYSIDSWKELLHPQDLDSTISALNNHLKNKTPFYQAEYRTKTKLGNYIWVLDTGKIMEYDALGEPLRVVGTNIDITSKKENELNLQQNLKQQELLSEISLELNSLDKFDNRINAILKKIGIHTDVSRVYIFEDFNDGFATCNTFEWCNCNIIPQIEELQEVPYEIIPSWKKLFFEKGRVYSENISELPEDLRTILEPQEIKSIVVYPLYVQGAYFGFIGFDECSSNLKHFMERFR